MTGDDRRSGTRRTLLAGAGVIAVLLLAHWRVAVAGPAYRGILLPLDHAYNVGLVLALVLLCAGLGGRLLSGGSPRREGSAERLLVAILLGAGIVATALLVVALSGLLSPTAVAAVLAAAAWVAREELGRTPARVARAVGSLPRSVVVVGGLVGAVLLLRAVAPVTDWDSLMYHLTLPGQFLETGRIHLPDDTLHVAFTGLAHMLYLPLLALGSSTAPALLSLALALLLPVAVFALAERLFGRESGRLSGVAIWGTTTLALVAVTARVDVTLALFLTVGHLCLYRVVDGDGGRPSLLVAGALLGMAMGVKYQGVAYVLALSPLVIWASLRAGDGRGFGWKEMGVLAGVAAAAAVPWFAKNWILLDAPFYPFLADRLLPPWLAELYGGRAVSDLVSPEVFGALAEVRRPFDLLSAFLHPERLSVEGEAAHYHLSPLLLLLPACVLWLRDRRLGWLVVPAAGYVALVLSASSTTNLRYLVPAVPALTIAASEILARVTAFVEERIAGAGPAAGGGTGGEGVSLGRGGRIAALVLVAASLVPTAAALGAWLPVEVSVSHILGGQSRTEYLSERRNPAMVIRAGLTDFGEREVPEDAQVLMMFDAREFYAPVPVLQDPLLTNWALLRPTLSEGGCLEDTGITHVLVNTAVLDYYVRRGLDPRTVRWTLFPDFAARCLERVLDVPGFRFYRVRSSAVAPRTG